MNYVLLGLVKRMNLDNRHLTAEALVSSLGISYKIATECLKTVRIPEYVVFEKNKKQCNCYNHEIITDGKFRFCGNCGTDAENYIYD